MLNQPERSFNKVGPVTKDVNIENQETELIYCALYYDMCTFRGLEGLEIFKAIFDLLKPNATIMTYWDGHKNSAPMIKAILS